MIVWNKAIITHSLGRIKRKIRIKRLSWGRIPKSSKKIKRVKNGEY